MKIQQLSLFLENKPGHLDTICQTLADARINIVTLALADTQQFGILRLIVEDWKRARDVLGSNGFVVNVREVVAIEVPDRPGGMAGIVKTLSTAGINIDYMYAFAARRSDSAVVVMRFDDADAAIAALSAAGHSVLAPVELFRNGTA